MKRKIIRRITFMLLCGMSLARLQGQDILQAYVDTALQRNIALQRQEFSYQESLAALEEAKALFWPQLSVEARYSVARGGRLIEFPVGDLVNPVYNNLNLINELGASLSADYPALPAYPQIANEEIPFLRETEHETKLRLAVPLFNKMIIQNQKIKREQVAIQDIGLDTYRRELKTEVETAFYNYHKAREARELYDNTLQLLEENVRTTESLERNHKLTADAVYAARAERDKVTQQGSEAQKNEQVARAFFNFLLNRPYDTEILQADEQTNRLAVVSVDAARRQGQQQREELKQLDHYLTLSDHNIKLEEGNRLPQLNLVADYGFQGTNYSFGKEDDYFIGSVVMSWKLFDKSNRYKVQQAQLQRDKLVQQKAELQQQIGLQIVQAWYELQAAREGLQAASSAAAAAEQAFRLVDRKYRQGQANLLEYTDARTRLTTAGQQQIIAQYDYYIRQSQLENAMAAQAQ